jgi:hypothetical protein
MVIRFVDNDAEKFEVLSKFIAQMWFFTFCWDERFQIK